MKALVDCPSCLRGRAVGIFALMAGTMQSSAGVVRVWLILLTYQPASVRIRHKGSYLTSLDGIRSGGQIVGQKFTSPTVAQARSDDLP
jgi:hypothetical protein